MEPVLQEGKGVKEKRQSRKLLRMQRGEAMPVVQCDPGSKMTVCASPFLLDYAHLMCRSLTYGSYGSVEDIPC